MTNKKKHVPGYIRYPIAGISGVGASLLVHPLDLVRYRMQLSGEGGAAKDHKSWVHALSSIVRNEGLIGLRSGISANLLHQAVYTTTRVGTYTTLMDQLREAGHDGILYMALAAVLGGALAGAIATPLEVVLIRMTSDGKLPIEQRREYKHVFHALQRISREEGAKGLLTGFKPTIMRGVAANVSQLLSYYTSKEYFISNGYMENNTKCHLVCSQFAGLVMAFSMCPVDVIKTRIQFMESQTDTPLYSGIVDAVSKTVRKEGVTALWKGFGALYARCAPHTILLFIFSENLTYLYRRHCVDAPGVDY